VRLEGIDAPEQRQSCTGDKGLEVACGKLASKALARLIGAAAVTCVLLGKDRYGRLLGECSIDSTSLNKAMVQKPLGARLR
jgi:endonuclease YncB( thermonuclease family)